MDIQKNEGKGYLKATDPAFPRFFRQLPQKLHNCIKLHMNKPAKYDERRNSKTPTLDKGKVIYNEFDVNLVKQLQAWRDNPVWVDEPPVVKVSVPKGSLCNLHVKVNVGLPPSAVYNIVTDPDSKRVFKNIQEVISRKVLVDEGSRQLVEVEQAALWRFLWWSGTILVHVLVDQNRTDYSMKFKQVKTGFMKKFEGSWRVEPLFVDERHCFPSIPTTLADYQRCTGGKGRVGSRVSLDQFIQPAIIPPPPISWYVRGITAKTSEMMINDLRAEASVIRGSGGTGNSDKEAPGRSLNSCDESGRGGSMDIKQRWAMHRRYGRKCHRKALHWTAKFG